MARKKDTIYYGKPNKFKVPKDKVKKGVFLSDIHGPLKQINLEGIFKFLAEFKPNYVILGGDIVECEEMLMCDSKPFDFFKLQWYKRDLDYMLNVIQEIKNVCKPEQIFFLEGNHEHRYKKFYEKYKEHFEDLDLVLDFVADIQKLHPKVKATPYYDYHGHIMLGDCVFTHGQNWSTHFAQKVIQPWMGHARKVVVGHTHRYQVHSVNQALPDDTSPYALSAGCLSQKSPNWLKGKENSWVNGFVSFVIDKGNTYLTPHIIDKGKFFVGAKEYK